MTAPLANFKRTLATRAAATLNLADDAALIDAIVRTIRVPDADRGDLALGCFELGKRAGQPPPAMAKSVADALKSDTVFTNVEAVGPYVNVRIQAPALAQSVVAAARGADYGNSTVAAGKTVVVDFSSPNIAKPLAFHHIRSTVIGAAICRLHHAQGWKVVGINYLGDWGKQFGLLATGFKRHGDPARRSDAKHLVEAYVKSNKDADVESRKTAIAAPEEARKLAEEVRKARELVTATEEPKARKAAESKAKGWEKKLRAMRGTDEGDVLDGLDAWYARLQTQAEVARTELPQAEERDREARLFLKRMEEGDAAALAEWREYRDTSIAEFKRVYQRMGVHFDALEGESFYQKVLDATVEQVAKKPGLRISDGATVVDMPYKEGEPPVMLRTRDNTTLYVTRDVAAAQDRYARFAFDRSLYVVAADQSLHFDQLRRTLMAMDLPWADRIQHIPFGRVHGMSTRRGNVVFLDEVLDEAVQKAREICEASDKIDRTRLDETVESVGIGCVVFGDLKNLRMSDYTFKLEEVLNFEGLTGPYVQFSHARACSILRRAGGLPAEADLSLLTADEERGVMMALARFPEAVAEACESFEPSVVTRSLLEVAQSAASWLTAGNQDRAKRVLLDDPANAALRAARLHLVDSVRNTLARGLELLGLRAPTAM